MKTAKKILNVIRDNFPNGIRPDFIDTHKVLRLCGDENISRKAVADIIRENGIENGGRFYFISPDTATEIKYLFAELLQTNSIVYYSSVYKRHSAFFAQQNIFSPEVLKKIVRASKIFFCASDFCSTSFTTNLDSAVASLFKIKQNSLSLDDLQEKFPYVPPEKIRAVLSNTKKFLPTTSGEYGSVDKIKFDFEEIHAAKRQISAAIAAKGHATIDDYTLSSNFALNSAFAEKDLRNLIYEQFLTSDFARQGKRLVKKCAANKKTISLIQRLRNFIAAQSELTVEKLFTFAQNLGIAHHDALDTAYKNMIRVEKNLFVKDSQMHFDVRAVDEALNSFVQEKIIPLRSVTSFIGFPSIKGYSWNLFLLESFLRKYSRKYFYDTATVNSANVGAIYPRSMKFDSYLDVQSSVIVQEKVPLEISAVESFLSEQGFRSRRIGRGIERVIAGARTMMNSVG